MCDCFKADPLTTEEIRGRRASQYAAYLGNNGRFAVSMCDAATEEWAWCCVACLPLTFPCVQTHLRYQVLNHVAPGSEWSTYMCCQGYIPACLCFSPGNCFEQDAPRTCMCLEAYCCPGLAISSTRFLIMDKYNLMPDPCDNRLVRANNCIQLLSCFCHIAAHFDRNLADLENLVDILADLVFLCTAAMMTAQVAHEIKFRSHPEAQPSYGVVDDTTVVAPLNIDKIDRSD